MHLLLDGVLSSECSFGNQCVALAGCVGTNACGALFSVVLPESLDHATISYNFKFQEGYDWTKGGKLPGFCDAGAALGCRVSGASAALPAWHATSTLHLPMQIALPGALPKRMMVAGLPG
jgi:hypothetical protein